MTPVRHTTHFRVGLVVLISAGILAATLALLGVFGTRLQPRRYYIKFEGSVIGLRERASRVYYRGVEVGTVPQISVNSNDPRWIHVAIDVRPDFGIKKTMEANIIITDLTGIRNIELSGGTSRDPDLTPGGTIQGAKTLFEEIGSVTQNLITQSEELVTRLSSFLTPESRVHVAATLASIDRLTTATAGFPARAVQSLDTWDGFLNDADRILKEGGGQLTETLTAAQGLLDDPRLAETIKSASDLVGSLNRLVEETSSVIGQAKLRRSVDEAIALVGELTALARNLNGTLSENRAEIRRITTNLRLSSDNLRETTLALRNNPSALIRSAPPEDRQ